MPTSEDRDFFESLNKDLANTLNTSIRDAFKGVEVNFSKENAKLIGDAVSTAVKGAQKKDPKDSPEGGGQSTGGFFASLGGKLKGAATALFGAAVAMKGLAQPFQKAAADIQSFGTTMGRTVAMTGKTQLVGARALRDAAGNLKDLKFDSPQIETAFGQWGQSLDDAGKVLDAALRANVNATDTGTQTFLARSTGLGNSLAATNNFLATNTNVIGLATSRTNALGNSLIDTAKANGRVADSIFAAVAAFEATSKTQSVVFGKSFAAEMMQVVGAIEAAIPGTEMGSFLSKITAGDFESQQRARVMAATVGVDSAMLETNPQRFIAELLEGIERFSQQSGGGSMARALQMEVLAGLGGVSLTELQGALRVAETGTAADHLRTFAGPQLTDSEREALTKEEQRVITAVDSKAAANMKDFALSLAGTHVAFTALDTVSETLRKSFYEFDGELTALARRLGLISGGMAGMNMSKEATGIGSLLAFGAGGLAAARYGGRAMRAVGQGTARAAQATGRGLGRAGRAVAGPWGRTGTVAQATRGMGPFGGINPHTGLPHNVPQTLTPRAAAGGAGKAALLGRGASRIPILGGAIAGGMEYMETGDTSRAVSTGVGAAAGGWAGAAGGAAAGAAIGSVVPIIGTAAGALIGGILGGFGGGWFGGEAGKAINDTLIDPEETQQRRAEAALTEAEALKFKGTPEELRALAEQDALAAAQLEESQKQTSYMEIIAESLGSDNPSYDGTGYARMPTPIYEERYQGRFGTDEGDAWENVYYTQSYTDAQNRIAAQTAAERGVNS